MGGKLVNGQGERVSIESDVVYPLLKSSDVARNRLPRKQVLVPQHSLAESPLALQHRAPKAWRYLLAHKDAIEQRGSSIYRSRPPFSVFGIGPYSFAPWKVAIAGLHKELRFVKVGPLASRPVLLDDTCYFLSFNTEAACDLVLELLASPLATEFYSSLMFRDAKRPITAKLLNQLDLAALAKRLRLGPSKSGQLAEALDALANNPKKQRGQPRLL